MKKKITNLESPIQQTRLFESIKQKPFWIWDIQTHKEQDIRSNGQCCFNHIIGLPVKYDEEKPIFDYEKIIFDVLKDHKYLWIKKATGLGITEFMLRYMAWLCLRDDKIRNSHMCIVTGPRIDLAVYLIERMKGLFQQKKLFNTKETVIELNRVKIEAFPSHHLDTMRGLSDVSFVLLDEADFFPPSQQQDARDVSERYIGKSNPYLVMVSTPNAPNGLFENIERETESACLYKRLLLDYTYGIDRIYTPLEIEKAKSSPSFEREYNLKYLGLIGNVFHTKDIENSIVEYDIDNELINSYTYKSMGVDCGFGSSAFGIVVTRMTEGKIQIVFADEFDKPDYNVMLTKVLELMRIYAVDVIYVDGANPEFIRSIKLDIGERSDPLRYSQLIERARKYKRPVEEYMKVIPVHFSTEHRAMLAHCKMMVEKHTISIHPKFDKLLISLKTAIENGEGVLDKTATSYDDVFDAFRLAMKFYRSGNS